MASKAKAFVDPKTGRLVVLLNPALKGRKAARELKTGLRINNDGTPKLDKKGRQKRVTDMGRAYRAGYLAARKDSAKAWKANQAKANQGKN